MTTLILLCGLPGSGKTTFARQLEERGGVRLAALDLFIAQFECSQPDKNTLRPA